MCNSSNLQKVVQPQQSEKSMLKYFSPFILPFADVLHTCLREATREKESKKVAKVSRSRFFLHTKIVSNSRSSVALILLLTWRPTAQLYAIGRKNVFVTHLIRRIVKRVFCAIFAWQRRRDLPRRLDVEAFSKHFSLYFVDNHRWCPPTMMLSFWWISLKKANQSMNAWVKMNIDGYLHVQVWTCVIWPSRKWVMENVQRWMHLATWRSDVCIPKLRWRKNSFFPWEFSLCCGWKSTQKAHGNAHNSFSQWHTIWKIR